MVSGSIVEILSRARLHRVAEEQLSGEAAALAQELFALARSLETPQDRAHAARMARMMEDPNGKALSTMMADQVFRSRCPARAASQFRHLLREYGVPRYLPAEERLSMRLGAWASRVAPGIVMPLITGKMRAESRRVILDADEKLLANHLEKRRQEGVRLNLNLLGEAILGEEEAQRRLQANLTLLARPEVDYISVKISGIFSQLNLIAFDETLGRIKERLRLLYRAAMEHPVRKADGTKTAKFVNLDMEEYRDLELTEAAFRAVLTENEFQNLEAGIVLQAYLPDSFAFQQKLTEWAMERRASEGGGVKIRIVKGANLAMERVDAALHGWPQAPYSTKAEVDANYKRMLLYGCQPEHAQAVRIGVASHNLFDIAYALLLREFYGVSGRIEFEMLEGMANPEARAVQEVAGAILLYAPVVTKADFPNAIAYLMRRLDENTAEENFLRHSFELRAGSQEWVQQSEAFLQSCRRREQVSTTANRGQNRMTEMRRFDPAEPFQNEPDTDWTRAANRAWVQAALERQRALPPENIPLQMGGELVGEFHAESGSDSNRPGVVAYRYALADKTQVDRALEIAAEAVAHWSATTVAMRKVRLLKVAEEFAKRRGETIACMVTDGGKAIAEADAEVSEAVDYAKYYARSFDSDGVFDGCELRPLGVVVVAPPWNFPYAIPAGGVLAALVAGNAVILKPAPETVLTAWRLANQCWDAGIPRDVLQFLPCPDDETGRALITSPQTAAVILTGAFETARMFEAWKPEIRLLAETSGKNSIIVTAAADVEQAIRDIVKSAFGHAGQKCSAASLAILEAEVYDDPAFLRQLRDAVRSLKVAPSTDPAGIVTPLIREPGEVLRRALSFLEPGETWLLQPETVGGNPRLWSPGVKLGVRPGGWFYKTECFGPVLGLMRADNLEHAMALQNGSNFGLTGGIHSLDDREIVRWRDHVEVGNAYINRPITGATVRRQPFGGWKDSAFGPGAKAGGPNYVLRFADWMEERLPTLGEEPTPGIASLATVLTATLRDEAEKRLVTAAARSFAYWWTAEFSLTHDPSHVLGETNQFCYRPCRGVLIRTSEAMSDRQLALCVLAAEICGVPYEVSIERHRPISEALARLRVAEVIVETTHQLVERLPRIADRFDRMRIASEASPRIHRACNALHWAVFDFPALANGRLELLNYLREQTISEVVHRHGNVQGSHSLRLGR